MRERPTEDTPYEYLFKTPLSIWSQHKVTVNRYIELMREYEHQAKHDFHQEFVSGKVVDVTVATDVDYDIYNRDEIEDVTLEFIVSYTLTGESLERKQRSWDNWKEVQRRVQAKKDADKAEMYAEIEAKAQRDEAKIEEKAYELFLQMKKKYEDVEEPTFFKKDE